MILCASYLHVRGGDLSAQAGELTLHAQTRLVSFAKPCLQALQAGLGFSCSSVSFSHCFSSESLGCLLCMASGVNGGTKRVHCMLPVALVPNLLLFQSSELLLQLHVQLGDVFHPPSRHCLLMHRHGGGAARGEHRIPGHASKPTLIHTLRQRVSPTWLRRRHALLPCLEGVLTVGDPRLLQVLDVPQQKIVLRVADVFGIGNAQAHASEAGNNHA
mmetsp:Transcript_34228/g.85293  ORF Transcript_34228/g.85293 Transcript_34228/m.85293 type:complete len:216 (-) Transcript_34228:314-961(-)